MGFVYVMCLFGKRTEMQTASVFDEIIGAAEDKAPPISQHVCLYQYTSESVCVERSSFVSFFMQPCCGLCMLFLVYIATQNLFSLSVCLNLLFPSRFSGIIVFAQCKLRCHRIYSCSRDKRSLKMEGKALYFRAFVDASLWQVEGHLNCSEESVNRSVTGLCLNGSLKCRAVCISTHA